MWKNLSPQVASCGLDSNFPSSETVESWFLELLYARPSGHMRRKYSGERPHTSKHSRSLG